MHNSPRNAPADARLIPSVASQLFEDVEGTALADNKTITWSTAFGSDAESGTVTRPAVMCLDTSKNLMSDDLASIVLKIGALTGLTIALFQRMNARGSMFFRATNAPASAKPNMAGYVIPAREGEGTQNPVINSIIKGQEGSRKAFDAGMGYEIACEPLYYAGGRVVRMLCCGTGDCTAHRDCAARCQ